MFLNSRKLVQQSTSRVIPILRRHLPCLATTTSSLSRRFLSSTGASEAKLVDENNDLQFSTLYELTTNASLHFAENNLFGTFNDGKYEWMTYADYGKKVATCRSLLRDLGAEENSKIGIISNNRWEWATISAAAYSLNATIVPMYEAQSPKDWLYILNDSECRVLFCANDEIYDRVIEEVAPAVPTLQATLSLDGEGKNGFSNAMAEMERKEVGASIVIPTPDDLANLIYTSGTTGRPKGVELLHSNIASNVVSIRRMVPHSSMICTENDRSLAFLPWAHSYGMTGELWSLMAHGASLGVCRGVPFILEDLQLVKPTLLFSVPTLYKRIYDGVNGIIQTSSGMRKKLMLASLDLGQKKSQLEKKGGGLGLIDGIKYSMLDAIVLEKIRARFGGNLRTGYCGGAAVPREIVEFMDSIGIPVCEGYGLTETSPIITLNVPMSRKAGSVGRPLPGVEVVVMGENGEVLGRNQEGEICCYGPNVMRGYYGNKDATDEVMTIAPDGKSRLFHTGDLGKMAEDGFVYITGRLKEQYKLENGKYICPTPIEETISLSRFILQVVVCGANRPHNVALLVPDWNAIRQELNEDALTEEELVNDERVTILIRGEVERQTSMLKKFEVPQSWAFVAPFTAANDMLTPKMSIRRHKVIKAYEDVINHLYGDEPIVAGSADGSHPEENVA
eukprot:CAMPEP_0172488806 /NCGR_PEP_ID=MMETSP1066-20121228/18529_1 /TAXON_ID=671091 /ORGANISM="Coscinodiscus wailesii, Strain CCMP2513" /LENGTH=676 /DNA_ID=CAMNT_0013256273 /DNA_START=120 /DNA_END=2150 /DNA_ORIENTATION=+